MTDSVPTTSGESTASGGVGEVDPTPQTPQSTTKQLLDYVLKRRRTKVIFILGLMRCGKSSLFESLTGKKGYSGDGIDSVTQEYQLGCARIDGEFYIFIDTPGFDDPRTTNEEVFRNIVACIKSIQDYVIFTGILYVHQLGSIYSAGQSVFINWLEALCGPSYLQQVTFVTTKWDEVVTKALPKKMAMLEEWMIKWSAFLEHGALMYHHGKKYNPTGFDLGIILDPEEDEKERKKQARWMISRHYKGKQSLHPQLVMELKGETAIEDTTAGRSLGMQPSSVVETLPERGPNWTTMLIDLLLWPMKRLLELVQEISKHLPNAVWRQRLGKKGFEIIITMPLGTEIAVGWGEKGLYVDAPPVDSDGEDNGFEAAEEWDGDGEDLLAGFGDSPDERQFAEAVRRTMEERVGRTCLVM